MVAGDFNIGHPADGPARQPWLERAHVLWSKIGLVSAYHAFFGEDVGRSSRLTYFHRYHPNGGWHIHWVLFHRSRVKDLRSVTVGDYDDWTAAGAAARSDHVPVSVDVDW